ncbi:MAG: hybrid sensor histidine kinase/response regulator [Bacteroidota bacterium]|nr:hybrid sensor histidine kinase/response regulator [Bacteroidota bacterium]
MNMPIGNKIVKEDYTVLIVDDQEEVLELVVPRLKLEGYKVLKAQSGPEAIEIIKNGSVDVMLLDFFMPGMTGEDVVREVRTFNSEIIIILQTGYSGEKPPLDMLESLNIQGYHDKTDGMEKLFLWLMAGVRMSELVHEVKRMFEEVALANNTIKSIKEDQARLIEQERLASLGHLIGGITHNLKTPIMSIAGGLEGLDELINEYDESIDDPGVTKEDHHEIAKEMRTWTGKLKPYCSYMGDIISAVKDQAANLNTYSESTFTIDELVQKVDILMKHELKYAYCKLNTDIQVDSSTKIKGAINNLVQVLNNLISNAIQAYDKDGGEIDFKVEHVGDNIKFTVRDHGKGMPKDVQDKLFKETITTKGKDGTGLGVYVSYSSIKGNFNGDMSFESEEGKGTTFYVSIPVSK